MIIPKSSVAPAEASWSVILNPINGELAKSRAIDVLSQSFSITEEEASQLIENAPIILLEDLSYDTAQKIRYHFLDNKLDMVLTNNPLQKRKCFKTVWPEEPRLQFLKHAPSLLEETASSVRGEMLPSDQAVAHIREEAARNGMPYFKSASSEDQDELRRKYEDLLRQHNLILEEKLIQEQKLEALDREIRFLRDKENMTSGNLKSLTAERENLLHELEALRIKHELLLKQQETQESPREKRLQALESANNVLKERLESIQREYEDAEKLWVRKFNAKQDEYEALKNEAVTLNSKVSETTLKLQEIEQTHQKALIDEGLMLREKALKDLVGRQQEIEKEITENEKLLKNILAEQDKLEKEIVRVKQLKSV